MPRKARSRTRFTEPADTRLDRHRETDRGTETHQVAWDGVTHLDITCVDGSSYQFRVNLTHTSGLSGSTGRYPYDCTSTPSHHWPATVGSLRGQATLITCVCQR